MPVLLLSRTEACAMLQAVRCLEPVQATALFKVRSVDVVENSHIMVIDHLSSQYEKYPSWQSFKTAYGA